jgi:hypothetical protein
MKLYHFNPNDYGEEAFVCAESLEEAKNALIKTKKEIPPGPERDENGMLNSLIWDAHYQNSKVDNMVNCVNGYTIDEFESGQVVFSEIC